MTAGGSSAGQEPLVSVIVPVFNAEKYLLKTLSSIRGQTYRNLEIILVDDGSRDRSLAICREAAQEDGRIKVLTKENGGAGSARNMGILAAQGALIGFADSDDLLYPDMYETLVAGYLQAGEELAKTGRTDATPAADTGAKDALSGKPFLIQTGREEIDEEGKRLPDAVTPPASVTRIRASDFARSLLLYTGDSSMCTKLTPASVRGKNARGRFRPFDAAVRPDRRCRESAIHGLPCRAPRGKRDEKGKRSSVFQSLCGHCAAGRQGRGGDCAGAPGAFGCREGVRADRTARRSGT